MKTTPAILWTVAGVLGLIGTGYLLKIYVFDPAKVGPDNRSKIDTLNPIAKPKLQSVVADAKRRGYEVVVTSANRDYSKQDELHNQNPKNAPAGRSQHNFGTAEDLTLQKDGKYYGKSTSRAEWEKTGIPAMAKKKGIFWGADIPGYYDPVHFQYDKGVGIDKLVELKEKQQVEGNKVRIPVKNLLVFKDKNLLTIY